MSESDDGLRPWRPTLGSVAAGTDTAPTRPEARTGAFVALRDVLAMLLLIVGAIGADVSAFTISLGVGGLVTSLSLVGMSLVLGLGE